MKIAYLTVAREEIREAAEYYAAISPELGNAFKRELQQLLRRVGTMPLAWPPCGASGAGLRKCLLSRFPYMVIYAPLPGEVLVLAVGHQHRQPGYWRDRLVK
ncbi:MAG: type II toxin-antitoxin system RelE/ParE family toxin [Rugosibacter sp.]|nr:type II toxin-antitoxin system RelE/ParE family toxin [Rugosibacter sp.]